MDRSQPYANVEYNDLFILPVSDIEWEFVNQLVILDNGNLCTGKHPSLAKLRIQLSEKLCRI
jgi:hypothetical protein